MGRGAEHGCTALLDAFRQLEGSKDQRAGSVLQTVIKLSQLNPMTGSII